LSFAPLTAAIGTLSPTDGDRIPFEHKKLVVPD
jgi:hypothetical protein